MQYNSRHSYNLFFFKERNIKMNEGMNQINVVPFVNDGRRKKEHILKPIIVKMAMFTFMVTLAMILIFSGMKSVGCAIYVKEIAEFVLFVRYVSRRNNGTV